MESKNELRELVESIKRVTGKNQEEIAVEVGYGRNYISDSLSPTGKVSKKFVTRLREKYEDVLGMGYSENTNPSNPSSKGIKLTLDEILIYV